jgi:type II secretory pathway pseudopilin PulG
MKAIRKITSERAFTLLELLVVIGTFTVLLAVLSPALAGNRSGSKSFQCLNNNRQLYAAWRMYAEENSGGLVAAQGSIPFRPNWYTGGLDSNGGNASNWNTNQDMVRSPLWPYTGKSPPLFRCPSDQSSVIVSGVRILRLRSYSMSSVFGNGQWLDKTFNGVQFVWRTYGKTAEIVLPARTFLFTDEHPDSINDGTLVNACTGAQPNDPPSAAQIIDFPASYHNGACSLSFADGRAEIHRWLGLKIKPPITYLNNLTLNVPADDSWKDIQWLAQNTTVRR